MSNETTTASTIPTTIPSIPTSDTVVQECIAANSGKDIIKKWDLFSAIAYYILTIIVVVVIGVISYFSNSIKEIKANWPKYRCQPSIMPFAAIYGHDTGDNFKYCMGNIFKGSAMDVAGPFAGILSSFGGIVGSSMNSINSLRQSVSTMGGGINVIFQDFTDRIKNFFFQLRLSAIHMKNLLTRMYTILFSIMYMGLSGMTAASNFGNTVLFGFLDAFCFVPETEIMVLGKGLIPIYKATIGDILLDGSRITAKFHFGAQGQQMVRLKDIQVSTNHYVQHEGKWIFASEHPDAVPIGPYERNSLICLNTDTHNIPIGSYVFRDYDETEEGDEATMAFVEERLNSLKPSKQSNQSNEPIHENCPVFHPDTEIRMKDGTIQKARNIQVGDILSTGAKVGGIVHKEVREFCSLDSENWMGSATLVWDTLTQSWIRIGRLVEPKIYSGPFVGIGFFALTNSQIELANGTRTRDYMELCSPDTELVYAEMLRV